MVDATRESLRRDLFYREMAAAEAALRAKPQEWESYICESDAWLNAELLSE
jgi:hypothetical protein